MIASAGVRHVFNHWRWCATYSITGVGAVSVTSDAGATYSITGAGAEVAAQDAAGGSVWVVASSVRRARCLAEWCKAAATSILADQRMKRRRARGRRCRRRPAVPPLAAKACAPSIMVPTESANMRATTEKKKTTPGFAHDHWFSWCLDT